MNGSRLLPSAALLTSMPITCCCDHSEGLPPALIGSKLVPSSGRPTFRVIWPLAAGTAVVALAAGALAGALAPQPASASATSSTPRIACTFRRISRPPDSCLDYCTVGLQPPLFRHGRIGSAHLARSMSCEPTSCRRRPYAGGH